jgi:hypothetical protein
MHVGSEIHKVKNWLKIQGASASFFQLPGVQTLKFENSSKIIYVICQNLQFEMTVGKAPSY